MLDHTHKEFEGLDHKNKNAIAAAIFRLSQQTF